MTTRWQVCASRPVDYAVIQAPQLFARDNPLLAEFGRGAGSRRFVVVDDAVQRLYGQRIRAWFQAHGIDARLVPFVGGEDNKTVYAWRALARQLENFPIHRRDEPILAIGGGVLTDVVAFLAATHRRGVPHIKIPTTLMGYVDAAIGIKCGVNFEGAKNRLGTFEPPLAVLLDAGFLASLPMRHLRNGMGEIMKLAVIRDAALFRALEVAGADSLATRFATAAGQHLLDTAVEGMLQELTPNLYEDELARKVDFGHTFSYGLEALHADRLLHGEAVLLDVLVSVAVASGRGLLPAGAAHRVFALVDALGLAPDIGLLSGEVMWAAVQDRILHRNGRQRIPMPTAIGECTFVDDIHPAELASAIPFLRARFQERHERTVEC